MLKCTQKNYYYCCYNCYIIVEVKVISSKNYDAYTKSGTVFCNIYTSCEIFLFEAGMFDRYISSINFNMIVLIPAINSTIRPTFF